MEETGSVVQYIFSPCKLSLQVADQLEGFFVYSVEIEPQSEPARKA
jgi:hypothetical protein